MVTLTRLNSDMGDILLTNLNTPAQDCTVTMPVVSGKSAYDLAVENGYVGSLQDWLASLSGWKPVDSDFANYLEQHLQLSSLFNGVNSKIEANKVELDARIEERISEARAISTKLENEAQERIKEANELTKQLLDEAALRVADANKLRDDLQSEAYERALEMDQLADDILSEQVTRVNEIKNTVDLINQEVAARSNAIDTVSNNLINEQKARQSDISALVSDIDSLDSKANSNHTFILENYSTTSDANTETANQIKALKTTYIDPALNDKATVTAVEQVQTSVSKIDGKLVTVGSKLDGVIAESGKNKQDIAAVWTDMQVRVTAESALSTRIDNVVATTSNNDARIVAETKARTDADSAMASDISTMGTRVGKTEGKITTLEQVTTTTNSSLSQVSKKLDNLVITVDGKASSQALTDVSSRVTKAEGNITSQGQAITKLTNDLATTNSAVNTKASAAALTALTNRVTSSEGTITSHSEDITALENSVSGINSDLATKASSQAVNDLSSRVTTAEGKITSNASNITALTTSVNTKNRTYRQTSAPTTGLVVGDLWINTTANMNNETKRWNGTGWDILTDPRVSANSSAISTLQSTTTTQGNTITAQGQAINTLKSDMESVSNGLSSKADSTAVTGLTNRVTATEGKITTNSNAITSLAGRVTTAENSLTTKANASALNDYYTKVKADEAIAGQISTFNSNLVIGGVNQVINSEGERTSGAATNKEYLLYERSEHLKNFYDENLGKPITISFEIKVPVAGSVLVYTSNNSAHNWSINTPELVADTWTRVVVTASPQKHPSTPTSLVSTLEFYGTYSTGRIPTVRKVQVESGNKATAWSLSPRDTKASLDANATAISNLTTRVTNTEGSITSQSSSITNLSNSVSTAQNTADAKGKVIYSNTAPAAADQLPQNLWIDTTSNYNTPKRWNGSAWLAVTDKVALDALTQANTNKDTITTKADASAVSTLANRVTTAEGKITSNSNSITTLNNNLSTLTNTVNTKADSSALSSLGSKVTSLEGTVTSQGSSITTLNNSLTTTNNNVTAKGKVIYGTTAPVAADQLSQNLWIDTTNSANTPKRWNGTAWVVISDKAATDALAAANQANSTLTTKADSSALNSLTTRVNTAEGNITSQGTSITNLQNSISTINGSLNTKADSSALSTLYNTVTSIDGRTTANANSITSLQGSVETINGKLSTKAESSALNNYYTKQDSDSAIAGKISEFKANYVLPELGKKFDASAISNYYTKSDADSAISSKIDSFKANYVDTELGKKFNASAISDYYTIAKANEAMTNKIDSFNSSLVIGSRNLALNTDVVVNAYYWGIDTTLPLIVGKEYTLSFDYIGNASGWVFLNKSISKSYPAISTTTWVRRSVTFIFVKDDYQGRELYPHVYGATQLKNMKLELGNKATDWAPAPEDINQKIAETNANITNNYYTKTQANGAIASQTSDIRTTVGNHTTSIQQHSESINGIKANWTLRLNSNGRVSGMTLMNDGRTSEFAIEADNFYVGAIDSAYKPFQVKTVGWTGVDGRSYPSGVYINNAVIGDLDAKVIRAGTITGDKIKASSITGDKIEAGSITADRIQIGSLGRDRLDTGLGNIVDTAYSTAKSANNKVNNLSVGGRNLLFNSNFTGPASSKGWANNGGGYVKVTDPIKGEVVSTNTPSGLAHSWLKLENGVEYTYSAMVLFAQDTATTSSTPLHFWAGLGPNNQGKISVLNVSHSMIPANVWTVISMRFKLISDADSFRPFFYGTTAQNVKIAWTQLEKGNLATDWTPAPEDVQNNINTVSSVASDARDLLNRWKANGNGTLYIDDNQIAVNKIGANQIAAGAITADHIYGDSITGDKIKANTSINAPQINGGEININNNFVVKPDGTVTIRSATSGGRLEINSNLIRVFDANGTLRVRLGVW